MCDEAHGGPSAPPARPSWSVPAGSFGAIQEVADNDGNVTHYKYTDKNGSVVFTDSLAKIPEEYRKKNKLVRVGPPKSNKAPVEAKTGGGNTAASRDAAVPMFQVKPEAVPPQGNRPAAISG